MASGRRAERFVVQSADILADLELPTLIECSDIPTNHTDIPTPEVDRCYQHLSEIAADIPELNSDCSIGLLIGRDLLPAHHVHQQIVGPEHLCYVSEMCVFFFL